MPRTTIIDLKMELEEYKNTCNKHIENLNNQIFNLKSMIQQLEEQLNIIKEEYNRSSDPVGEIVINNCKELMNKYQIEIIDIMKHLEGRDILSDCNLLRKIYLNTVEYDRYPIKISPEKNRIYQYWDGCRWMTDRDGMNIRRIISTNLKRLYISVNNDHNYRDQDKLLLNQEYIVKTMNSHDYQARLFKMFKGYLA